MARPRSILIVTIIVLIAVGGLGWYLVSPLFLSTTVEEEFPLSRGAIIPDDMTQIQVEQLFAEEAEITKEMNEEMPKVMMSTEELMTGRFHDADSSHKGSGQATIYRLPDGTHVLRLEDFKVTNGPDLHVILTPHPDPQNRSDIEAQGYVDLGQLKGNLGNQNYDIPAGVDVSSIGSVVIYCVPFHVIFSVAPLE